MLPSINLDELITINNLNAKAVKQGIGAYYKTLGIQEPENGDQYKKELENQLERVLRKTLPRLYEVDFGATLDVQGCLEDMSAGDAISYAVDLHEFAIDEESKTNKEILLQHFLVLNESNTPTGLNLLAQKTEKWRQEISKKKPNKIKLPENITDVTAWNAATEAVCHHVNIVATNQILQALHVLNTELNVVDSHKIPDNYEELLLMQKRANRSLLARMFRFFQCSQPEESKFNPKKVYPSPKDFSKRNNSCISF